MSASEMSRFMQEAKLITCILPDDGRYHKLLKLLRDQFGILTAHGFPCRGFHSFQQKGRAVAVSVRLLKVMVRQEQADEIFAFLYHHAGFDQPIQDGCLMYQNSLLGSTDFVLPDGIALEEDD